MSTAWHPGMYLSLIVGSLILATSALTGCGGGGGKSAITLYNGQHPQLTQALVAAFEHRTGVHVQVRNGDGIVLAAQLLQEASSSPADVYLAENSPELEVLSEHHLLAKLPASITSQIPGKYESPHGNWVGIALRVSALVYNPSRISPARLPPHLLDLAQPRWKGKLAIAPTDSDFPPLVGGVIATYGRKAATNWVRGLMTNAALYPDEEAVVAAVDRGQQAVGVINQYYWYRLRLEQGAEHTHSKLYFFPNHDVGSLANISGAAVIASSHRKAQADAFVRFLVSAQAQRILARSNDFEYPVRSGVTPNPSLPRLSRLDPVDMSIAKLGDDQQSASLLQQIGHG